MTFWRLGLLTAYR